MRKGKVFHFFALLLSIAAVGAIALLSLYKVWERAPATAAAPALRRTDGQADEGSPVVTQREDGVYTILLVGNDDGNGNTDTLMLGKIDTVQHRMDFVSIPRDTLVNSPWEVRKINAAYWGSRNSGGDGIGALRGQIQRLTGFDVDCYAVLDLDVFVQAVDAMGGVWFDVPQAMDYEDPSQNLYIHIQPGYQLLDGEQAMGVCRYRSGYYNGDLGRIDMQHRFLAACAEQFISLGNIPNISKVVDILAKGLETDLSAANIAFFLRQALQCSSEDVHFYTAPFVEATVAGYSYILLDLWPWLDMVNSTLNPYAIPVGYTDVDIVYRNEYGIACTGELRDPEYYTRESTDGSE